jgi:serpin B
MALLADESFTNLAKVSLTITKHLFSKQEYKDNNVLFSPLSLQVVLSIITAGSEGPTRQQLLDFLQFKSTDHLNSVVSHLLSFILKESIPSHRPSTSFFGHYFPPATPASLSFTNGVWVEQTLSLQPSFEEIVSSCYKATLSSADFINNVCIYLSFSLLFSIIQVI